VQGEPGVDDVLDEQHVAVTDVGVEVLEQPHRTPAARRAPVVAGELDEVEPVHDPRRPGEVGEEHEARLERSDEERLTAGIVLGDLGSELGDARLDGLGREVDVADSAVGARLLGGSR
jgi:hypothetical protein